jgi:hypothetical protein
MSKMSKSVRRRPDRAATRTVDRVERAADALMRTANECIRLRQRYACLVERGATELEQRGARRLLCVGDQLLAEAVTVYERAAGQDQDHQNDDWWHRANGLWMACREYLRRHQDCDELAEEMDRRDEQAFARLAMDFDLEASALLFLQQAVDAAREARPDSLLTTGTHRIPA